MKRSEPVASRDSRAGEASSLAPGLVRAAVALGGSVLLHGLLAVALALPRAEPVRALVAPGALVPVEVRWAEGSGPLSGLGVPGKAPAVPASAPARAESPPRANPVARTRASPPQAPRRASEPLAPPAPSQDTPAPVAAPGAVAEALKAAPAPSEALEAAPAPSEALQAAPSSSEAPTQPEAPQEASSPLARVEPPPAASGAGAGAQALGAGGGSASSGGVRGEGAGGGAARGGGVELSAYARRLSTRVARQRRYPASAVRFRLEGTATVRVRVRREGVLVESPRLVGSSGHGLLDAEALRMVEAAAPFLPLPEGYPRDSAEFIIPVHFSLRSQG